MVLELTMEINIKHMETLIEQLQSNTEALESLDERIYNTKMGSYWTYFATESERQTEVNWVLKIKKRVLKMRFRILENIKSATLKEMQSTSVQSRELNLKAA